MAREIKAVQCPKCGSTQKIEIREHYYKCTSCDTEYFLDNDDVTITHNVNYNTVGAPQPISKKPLAVIGILFLAMFILTMIIWGLAGSSDSSSSAFTMPELETEYSWRDHDEVAFTDKDGNPILLIFGQREIRTGDDESKTGRYAVFYDMLSGKEIKNLQVKDIPVITSERFDFQLFQNGDIYLIANSAQLFKVNKTKMTLEPVTNLSKEHPELEAGIADFEFTNQNYGNGIKVLTNDGKGYTYYPIANKVYNQAQIRKIENALEERDPNAKTRNFFDFSIQSTDFPEQKIQLFKWKQKDNLGGPNEWPYFERSTWYDGNVLREKAFRGSGDVVISYEDFTPDRLYFSPEMLYSDDDYVLISVNATPSKNAKTSLQCLDAKTAKILFTATFDDTTFYSETVVRLKNGFVVFSPSKAMVLNMEGKVVNQLDI